MIANSDIEKVRIFCRNPTYKNWVSLSKDTKKMLIDFSAKDSSKNRFYKKVITDNTPAYNHIDNLESNLVALQQAIDDIATKQSNHVLETSTKIDNMVNNIGRFQNENTHDDVMSAIQNLSSEINNKFQDYSNQLSSIRTQTVSNGLSNEEHTIKLNMEAKKQEISLANNTIRNLTTDNKELRDRVLELESRKVIPQTLSSMLEKVYGKDTIDLENLVKFETEITNIIKYPNSETKDNVIKYKKCLTDFMKAIGAVDSNKAQIAKQQQAEKVQKAAEQAAKNKAQAVIKQQEAAAQAAKNKAQAVKQQQEAAAQAAKNKEEEEAAEAKKKKEAEAKKEKEAEAEKKKAAAEAEAKKNEKAAAAAAAEMANQQEEAKKKKEAEAEAKKNKKAAAAAERANQQEVAKKKKEAAAAEKSTAARRKMNARVKNNTDKGQYSRDAAKAEAAKAEAAKAEAVVVVAEAEAEAVVAAAAVAEAEAEVAAAAELEAVLRQLQQATDEATKNDTKNVNEFDGMHKF